MFNSMIHANESVSNIDKFRDPALSLVCAKPLISQNFINGTTITDQSPFFIGALIMNQRKFLI